MSQATGRPDFFGRSKDEAKPGLRKQLSVGMLSLVAAMVVWTFGIGTAAKCFIFAQQVWNGGMAEFMHASVGSLSFSAAGLHYEGQWGAVMAAGQGLIVLLGLGLTLSPAVWLRRLGSLFLMAWAGLWIAGGVSLAMEVPEPEQMGIAAATGVVLLSTMYRTAKIWSPRKKKGKK